jgi:site-specific DNA-cytosine methylase
VQRIKHLMSLYTLLAPDAVQGAFSLPQDIRDLSTEHLVAAGAQQQQHPWLVVAGWPCQDLSIAGKAAGLQGERSSLLHELVRVIGALQQLQPDLHPAFLIENVAFQCHPSKHISQQDYNTACDMIGQPVMLDAAQFGSLAHRVRNWWTNLCTPAELASAAAQVKRPPGRTVSLALSAGRTAQEVRTADRWPRYCCNVPGAPMQAWPTFVAYPKSYAFLPGEPGSVLNSDGSYDQPTADERELAMGYPQGSTAAPGVSEQQRRSALGESMDSNCTQCIMAIAAAWARAQTQASPAPELNATSYETACMLATAAAAQEQLSQSPASTDIWHDAAAMHMLQHGTMPEGTTAADRSRISKRLTYYQWEQGKVLRRMPDGALRQVPPPKDRMEIIKQLHNRCGHLASGVQPPWCSTHSGGMACKLTWHTW